MSQLRASHLEWKKMTRIDGIRNATTLDILIWFKNVYLLLRRIYNSKETKVINHQNLDSIPKMLSENACEKFI